MALTDHRVATQADVDTAALKNWIDANIVPMHGVSAAMQVNDLILADITKIYTKYGDDHPSYLYEALTGAASGNDSGDPDFVVTTTIPSTLPSEGVIEVDDGASGYDFYHYSSYTGSTFTLDTTDHPTGLDRNYAGSDSCWAFKMRIGATVWMDGEALGMDITDFNTYTHFQYLRGTVSTVATKYITTADNPLIIRPLRGQICIDGNPANGATWIFHQFEHVVYDGESVAYPGLRIPFQNGEKFLHGTFGFVTWDWNLEASHTHNWEPGLYATNPTITCIGWEAIGGFAGFRWCQGGVPGSDIDIGMMALIRCYRHDAEDGEGTYWGSTQAGEKPLINGYLIEDCIFGRCATEAIQIQHTVNNSIKKQIRNNIIISSTDCISPFQGAQSGMFQLYAGDGNAFVEKNICMGSPSNPFILFGTDLGAGEGRIVVRDMLFYDVRAGMYIHNSTSGAGLGAMDMEWQRAHFMNKSDKQNRTLVDDDIDYVFWGNLGDLSYSLKNVSKDSSMGTDMILSGDEGDYDRYNIPDDDTKVLPQFNNPGFEYARIAGKYDYLGVFAFSMWARDGQARDIVSITNNGSGIARIVLGTTHGLSGGEDIFINGTVNHDGNYTGAAVIVNTTTIDVTGCTYVADEGAVANAVDTPPIYYKDEIVNEINNSTGTAFYMCIAAVSCKPTSISYVPSGDPSNWVRIYWDVNGIRSDKPGYTGTPDPRTGGIFPPDDFRLVAGDYWQERRYGLSINFTNRERYQWQKKDGSIWLDIPGVDAKKQRYDTGGVVGTYRCRYQYQGKTSYSEEIVISYVDWSESLSITIDNTGNIEALDNDQVELLLDSTFDFDSAKSGGADIRFEYLNGTIIKYFIEYWDDTNKKARIWLQISANALSTQAITMYYGNADADSESDFSIMQRMTSHEDMLNLFPFDTDGDDDIANNDFTLNNCSIADSGFGNALSLNGSTGYATSDIAINFNGVAYGTFCFGFINKTLHQAGSGVKTIFSIYYDADDYIILYFNNAGKIQCDISKAGVVKSYTTTDVSWPALRKHFIFFSYSRVHKIIFCKLDNKPFFGTPDDVFPTYAATNPFTFGCKNNGSQSEFFDGYIYDFAKFSTYAKYTYLRAWADSVNLYNRTFVEKLEFRGSFPVPYPRTDNKKNGEAGVYWDGSTLHWYGSGYDNVTTDRYADYATSNDQGQTWSAVTKILGQGVGGESGEVARVNIYIEGNKEYLFYVIHNENNAVYRVERTGFTGSFGNKTTVLSAGSYARLDNACVTLEGGVYHMAIEVSGEGGAGGSLFATAYAYGTSLDSFQFADFDYYHTAKLADSINRKGAAPEMLKISNDWYIFNNSALEPQNALPVEIYAYTSKTPTIDNWRRLYEFPVLTFDYANAEDQVTNVDLKTFSDRCFLCIDYTDNSGTLSRDVIFRYLGTGEQLIADVKSSYASNVSPVFSTGEVGSVDILTPEITFDASLASGKVDGTYYLHGSTTGWFECNNPAISGGKLRITLDQWPAKDETLTFYYYPDGADSLQNASGVTVQAFSSAITNNSEMESSFEYIYMDSKNFGSYIDTLLYSTPFTKDYWHVFISVTPDDGQPPTSESLFGGWDGVDICHLLLMTNGKLRTKFGPTNKDSTDVLFSNGQETAHFIRVSQDTTNRTLYFDTVLKDTFSAENPGNQVTQTLYYGALNNNGSPANSFNGVGNGLVIYSGDADLSANEIAQLNTLFSNLS